MTSDLPVEAYPEGDYEAILSAVTETHRGRWFLAEHERRHHGAETDKVLDQLAKLERILVRERRPDADRIRLDIGEMKDAIERTKLEISQIKVDRKIGSRFIHASNELDAIVTQTEAATSEILETAEKIQEIAFEAREAGAPADVCDRLEEYTTTIFLGCSFQDLTGQRTQKVVHVLRFLESRIDAMIEIWGLEPEEIERRAVDTTANPMDSRPDAHLLNGPQMAGHGVDQSAIDGLMDTDGTEAGEIDFDSIDINDIDFDSIDTGEDATGEDAAGDGETGGAPEEAVHHAHVIGQPETQAEVDELFADAAFEAEDQDAAAEAAAKTAADSAALVETAGSQDDSDEEDALAMLEPHERRALFS